MPARHRPVPDPDALADLPRGLRFHPAAHGPPHHPGRTGGHRTRPGRHPGRQRWLRGQRPGDSRRRAPVQGGHLPAPHPPRRPGLPHMAARPRPDGVFRIARRVAADQVISAVDPQARHGHKTSARGFDGYKGHIAIDPDSEVITATAVMPGTGDAGEASGLLADLLPGDQDSDAGGTAGPAGGQGAAPGEGRPAVYGDALRAENLVHGSDQQSCSTSRLIVTISGHAPTVRLPSHHVGHTWLGRGPIRRVPAGAGPAGRATPAHLAAPRCGAGHRGRERRPGARRWTTR